MKINPYADHISCPIPKAAQSPAGEPAISESKGSFDTVTVGSKTAAPSPSFSDLLTSRISMEVRHTASAHKLNALSRQVADGTYPIDPEAIAAAITMTSPMKEYH